jgi:hypothetical protein
MPGRLDHLELQATDRDLLAVVHLRILCEPRDYADLGGRESPPGDPSWPGEVGIIYSPSRNAKILSAGW